MLARTPTPRIDIPPADSQIAAYAAPGDYMDCFAIALADRPDLQTCDPRRLAEHCGTIDFAWSRGLLWLRDTLVKPLGLKATPDLSADQIHKPAEEKTVGDRVNFFRIFAIEEHEVLLGEDDLHQDFRLSVLRTCGPDAKLVLTTVCKRHNWFGHVYLASILPVHKKLVKATLETAIEKPLPKPAG